MKRLKLILAVLLILVAVDVAAAATLHGKIYDIELNELNSVIVEVDSEPAQRYVSKDGAYSFSLGSGEYTLSANYTAGKYSHLTVEENVTITGDGDYVFDLFLFPDMGLEDEPLSDSDLDISEPIETAGNGTLTRDTILIIILAVIFLIVLYFIVGHFKRKEEQLEIEEVENVESLAKSSLKDQMDDAIETDTNEKAKSKKNHDFSEDLHKIVAILRKEGGRATQRELRKEFPLSEAKISLMISELEHKGVVKKVKKGRGNIIILKKK